MTRKLVAYVSMVFLFFLTYFLQVNLFNYITIFNVKPNLFVIFILVIALFAGSKRGFIIGTCLGLMLDLFVSRTIGVYGIMFGIIVLFGDFINKNFSKTSRLTQILIALIGTILFEAGTYLLRIVLLKVPFESLEFIKIVGIESVYNAILIIILYGGIIRIGEFLEGSFENITQSSSYHIR